MIFRKRSLRRWHPAGLTALWLATCAGCGGRGLVPVEGNVTFDGTAVESGTIVFEPADGKGATAGGSIEAGKYRLSGKSGVAPGKKVVRIRGVRKTGRKIETGPPDPPGTMVEETESFVPAKYNTQSTLTYEVTASGANRPDFDLKSK